MQFTVHIDKPSNSLIQNFNFDIVGWIAINKLNPSRLSFKMNNIACHANLSKRTDVEKSLNIGDISNVRATGWHLQVNRDMVYKTQGRVLTLHIYYDDYLVFEKIFYKSAPLRTEEDASPMVFMHIPKTAGTALRTYVDYAFSEWPVLYIYDDYPGIKSTDLMNLTPQFIASREVTFGHYAFDFNERFTKNSKYFVVIREPQSLIHSYINFTSNYDYNLIDNPLIRYISGAYGKIAYGKLTEQHLDIAIKNINSNFYVIQADKLQDFADEMSGLLGLKKLHIPRINEGKYKYNAKAVDLSVPPLWHLDKKLYEYSISHKQSLKDFICS